MRLNNCRGRINMVGVKGQHSCLRGEALTTRCPAKGTCLECWVSIIISAIQACPKQIDGSIHHCRWFDGIWLNGDNWNIWLNHCR
mmetsp:Transcript_65624/g.185426  ORF Transcript_65624/g.185426 Transcript_65624/m.185426 type:complete len:85 (-) Transcript_65624:104-358(-)